MAEAAYTILEALSERRNVTVFKAEDEESRRRVQLVRFETTPDFSARDVESRIELASLLQANPHPNLVSVDACWIDEDNTGYVAYDWQSGTSLLEQIESGLDVSQLALTFADVCEALNHLHDYGIVHADIKPSNIIMDPSGNGVLSNFEGLAFADQEARFSDIEVGYSSPESVASERVDRASDVYSLGASLYQTLVGEFAWLDEDGEPRNQTENDVIPTLPVQHAVFQRILHRLLTFDPSERTEDLLELRDRFLDLREPFASSRVIRADPISSRELGRVLPTIDTETMVAVDSDWPQRFGVLKPALSIAASLLFYALFVFAFQERATIAELLAQAGFGEHPELKERELAASTIRADPNQSLSAMLAAYNRVLEIAPDNAQALQAIPDVQDEWKSRISSAIDTNDLQRARVQLNELIDIDPNDTEVRLLYTRLDTRQRAIRLLDDTRVLLERTGIDNPSTAAIALLAYRQGIELYPDSDEAKAQLDQLAGQYVESAVAAVNAGDLTAAMANLGDAVTANPDHVSIENVRELISQAETLQSEINAMLQRASDFRVAGQLINPPANNAAELYHQVLATDPENTVAAQGLSEINTQTVRLVEQLMEERKLMEVRALLERSTSVGLNADSVGQMREQLDLLLERIASAATLHAEAETLYELGYITEPVDRSAVSLLREALRLDSKNTNAIALLQRCAERLADVAQDAKDWNMDEEAKLYLELAITVSPDTTRWQRLRDSWFPTDS